MQEEALEVAVPSVGSAIMGSGSTTIVGFLALTLSIMPMLQNLGLSLALGIFYSIISSVIVGPALLVMEENFQEWTKKNAIKKLLGDTNGGDER